MNRERKHESRREINESKEEKSQLTTEEMNRLRETVENKANGIRIFEIIKEGLLQETLDKLDDQEHGFDSRANELSERHSDQMQEIDREMGELQLELEAEEDRMEVGRQNLEDVAQTFRSELTEYVDGTLTEFEQERQATTELREDVVARQEMFRRQRGDLMRILGELTPQKIKDLVGKRDADG